MISGFTRHHGERAYLRLPVVSYLGRFTTTVDSSEVILPNAETLWVAFRVIVVYL
jgi:hypothetical protein